MLVLSRRVEHPLDVTVQRLNDADAREHRWTVMFCNQQKRPHRGCHSAPCSALGRSLPLLARTGLPAMSAVRSLLGVKRTWRGPSNSVENDPKAVQPGTT